MNDKKYNKPREIANGNFRLKAIGKRFKAEKCSCPRRKCAKNDTSADKRKAGVFTSARGSGIGVAVLPTTGGEENDEEEQNAETDAHQKSHASEENVIALGGIRGIVFAGFGGSV